MLGECQHFLLLLTILMMVEFPNKFLVQTDTVVLLLFVRLLRHSSFQMPFFDAAGIDCLDSISIVIYDDADSDRGLALRWPRVVSVFISSLT